jgi:hypothetical protein
MISKRPCLLLALATTLFLIGASQQALACACCANAGERTDIVMKLNAGHVEELQQLRFERAAQLFLGAADPASVKGITNPAEKYDLQSSWQNNRMIFAFRDEAGGAGSLSVRLNSIGIFHVDPRTKPDTGLGPVLYKEWRLSSKAEGTGVFAVGSGQGQTLTLVLQGHGNNCTSAGDFTHWMLAMWGPKAKYRFFGSLIRAP